MSMSDLTTKQEGFCLSVVETGNTAEAYRRNYSHKNMKDAQEKRWYLVKVLSFFDINIPSYDCFTALYYQYY